MSEYRTAVQCWNLGIHGIQCYNNNVNRTEPTTPKQANKQKRNLLIDTTNRHNRNLPKVYIVHIKISIVTLGGIRLVACRHGFVGGVIVVSSVSVGALINVVVVCLILSV